jgi:hypothetical protein
MLALDDQYIVALALEQRGGDRAGGACANDDDLSTFRFNC